MTATAPVNGSGSRVRELVEPARLRERIAMLVDGPEAIASLHYRPTEQAEWVEISASRVTDEEAPVPVGLFRVVGKTGAELAAFAVREPIEQGDKRRSSSREVEALVQGFELVLAQSRAINADAQAALERALGLVSSLVDRMAQVPATVPAQVSPMTELVQGLGPVARELGLAWMAQRAQAAAQPAAPSATDQRAMFEASAIAIAERVPPDVRRAVEAAAADVLAGRPPPAPVDAAAVPSGEIEQPAPRAKKKKAAAP